MPAFAYEIFGRNIRPLVYMCHVAFGVKIDGNQLMFSEIRQKAVNWVKEWNSVLLNLENIFNLIYIFKNNWFSF